jgi:hypothetical protein
MATVKKGMLTAAGEWWKHLRWTKRPFWKGERKAAKADALEQIEVHASCGCIFCDIDIPTDREGYHFTPGGLHIKCMRIGSE